MVISMDGNINFDYKKIADVFLSKLARKGTKEEWMNIISKYVPIEYQEEALQYVLEQQNNMNLPTTSIYEYSSKNNKF